MAVTITYEAGIIPAPPEGWVYWHTESWTINQVHEFSSAEISKLLMTPTGLIAALINPGERRYVHWPDELPAKLHIYQPKAPEKW